VFFLALDSCTGHALGSLLSTQGHVPLAVQLQILRLLPTATTAAASWPQSLPAKTAMLAFKTCSAGVLTPCDVGSAT
jgi:hypothetical protein